MVLAARSSGVPVESLLAEEGITLEQLEDPDERLPAPTLLRLWATLKDAADDPALHLRAPLALPNGAYRVCDHLAAATPTLGEWIDRFARYLTIIHNGVAPRVELREKHPVFILALASGEPIPPDWAEYAFSALIGRTRLWGYPTWEPHHVEVVRERPDDPSPWERAFHAPVSFGAAQYRLVIRRTDWSLAAQDANSALVQVLDEYADFLAAAVPQPSDRLARVRSAISQHLQDGAPGAVVAETLGTSLRSLQRSLTELGTTYTQLVERVRCDLAKRHLSEAELPMTEVAYLLGFSEQSSFQRAFKRWTGFTPGRWRRGVR